MDSHSLNMGGIRFRMAPLICNLICLSLLLFLTFCHEKEKEEEKTPDNPSEAPLEKAPAAKIFPPLPSAAAEKARLFIRTHHCEFWHSAFYPDAHIALAVQNPVSPELL